MSIFSFFRDNWKKGWNESKLRKRRSDITDALVAGAKQALRDGGRFGIRPDTFQDPDHVQEFIVRLSKNMDENVRASSLFGMVVVYQDGSDPQGTDITIAGVEN